MSDSRDFKIESAMSRIMGDFPLDMKEEESDFSKDLLLLFLYEYRMFNQSFTHAAKEYGKGGDFNEAMSKVMGFESEQEFNNVMFLREVMRSCSLFLRTPSAPDFRSHSPHKSGSTISFLFFLQNLLP